MQLMGCEFLWSAFIIGIHLGDSGSVSVYGDGGDRCGWRGGGWRGDGVEGVCGFGRCTHGM